jgi:hypothetical protein
MHGTDSPDHDGQAKQSVVAAFKVSKLQWIYNRVILLGVLKQALEFSFISID